MCVETWNIRKVQHLLPYQKSARGAKWKIKQWKSIVDTLSYSHFSLHIFPQAAAMEELSHGTIHWIIQYDTLILKNKAGIKCFSQLQDVMFICSRMMYSYKFCDICGVNQPRIRKGTWYSMFGIKVTTLECISVTLECIYFMFLHGSVLTSKVKVNLSYIS